MNGVFLTLLLTVCFLAANANLDLAEKLLMLDEDFEDAPKDLGGVQKDWMIQETPLGKQKQWVDPGNVPSKLRRSYYLNPAYYGYRSYYNNYAYPLAYRRSLNARRKVYVPVVSRLRVPNPAYGRIYNDVLADVLDQESDE